MSGQPSLVRQWIVLRSLCTRRLGASVSELADELSVSKKTIRRDLETFQAVGFPLAETVEDRGRKRWRIAVQTAQPGLAFAFDEAIALYLGRRFLEPLAGTLLWDAAQRAFGKLRAFLTPGGLRYVERFSKVFHLTRVGTSDYSKKAAMIDLLTQAIEDCRAVLITYRSLRATESVTYDAYPYGLVCHFGRLYLVGWAPRREAIRTWRVDRMEEVGLTELRFNPRENFDLKSYLSGSFGIYRGDGAVHIKVRFSPSVARYVQESTWHPSQKLTRQKNGSLIAEFDLDTAEEIKHWLLSFGKHAVVLAPESLRQQISQELQSTLLQYRPAWQPAKEPPNRVHREDQDHES